MWKLRAMAGRLRKSAGSEQGLETLWWYWMLLLATAVAKLAYLGSVYRHSQGSLLSEMAASSGYPVPGWLMGGLILARDALQLSLLAALGALAWRLPERAARLVLRGAALLLLTLLGANQLSFEQLGAFLSPEVLETAWGWMARHPETPLRFASAGAVVAVVTGVLLVLLPRWLVLAGRRRRAWETLQSKLPRFTAGWLLCVSLAAPAGTLWLGSRSFPLHGYWSSLLSSLWRGQVKNPLALPIPRQNTLLQEYRKLSYATGPAPAPQLLSPEIEGAIRPRHVLLIGLETAPRAFYPLTTSQQLPTFARMTERAIVSAHHYTTSSYTRIANFSMLSGLYAPPEGLPVKWGPIAGDGFAAVLRQRAYETSYVDAWVLDWLPGTGERAQAEMLGFDTVLDNPVRRDDGVFEVLVKGEELAFQRAYERIETAESHGHKAAVFIGTMLGHAPWPAAEGNEALDGPARIMEIAKVFDRLLARLLAQLEARGLSDDVLILVVGDHGLRFADEFASLGHVYSHSDLSFDVPFLLYAPGLVTGTIHVPFATSHVDIAPTLLHLVGAPTQGMLHHGGYVLDRALAQRVLYLSNSKLGPVDGFTWNGQHFTYHALSGAAYVGSGAAPESMLPLTRSPMYALLPPALRDPAWVLEGFAQQARLASGKLLQRGSATLR